MKVKAKIGDIVVVGWLDAFSPDGEAWLNAEDVLDTMDDGYPIQTVGFVLGSNREYVTLAGSMAGLVDAVSGVMVIPKRWVTSWVVLH